MIWVWVVLLTLLTLVLAIVARRLHSTRERFSQVESRLAGVLEMSDAGLAVWNQQGRLVACNKRFREFYQTIELKSGLVYEDLTRFTATRGLIQLAEDNVETWVQDRLTGFGDPSHEVCRTPDGRWIEIDHRSTDSGEVLLVYTDISQRGETETRLSDHTDHIERQAAELTLLVDAIRIGSHQVNPDLAIAELVECVCVWAEWPVGYAYRAVRNSDDVVLNPIPAWFVESGSQETFDDLQEIVARRQIKKGDALVGRVLHTGRLSWIPNVTVDPSVDAEVRSAMTGIRGICAIPVKAGNETVAVLEFLSREQLVPDPATTRTLEAVASTLTGVFQRQAVS